MNHGVLILPCPPISDAQDIPQSLRARHGTGSDWVAVVLRNQVLLEAFFYGYSGGF